MLGMLSQTGVVGVCVVRSGASWPALSCTVCTCSLISLKGVLRRVFRRWIWGAARNDLQDVGVCESVGAMATLCVCMVWVATLYGVCYSRSVLVSLSMALQCCTFLFVFLGTIVLKRSNKSADAIIVWSPLEMAGTLHYARYNAYVPVVRHPPVSYFQ